MAAVFVAYGSRHGAGQGNGAYRTWDVPRPGFASPAGLALGGARDAAAWLASEVAAGRVLPWIPIGFGLGIVLYFTAERG